MHFLACRINGWPYWTIALLSLPKFQHKEQFHSNFLIYFRLTDDLTAQIWLKEVVLNCCYLFCRPVNFFKVFFKDFFFYAELMSSSYLSLLPLGRQPAPLANYEAQSTWGAARTCPGEVQTNIILAKLMRLFNMAGHFVWTLNDGLYLSLNEMHKAVSLCTLPSESLRTRNNVR